MLSINKEWLYEINSLSNKKIYSRESVSEGNQFDQFEFGPIDGESVTQGFVQYLGQGTPKKKSFLSDYFVRNGRGLDGVREAYNWFAKGLRVILSETHFQGIHFLSAQDENFKRTYRNLLGFFRTGIVDTINIPIPSWRATFLPENLLGDILKSVTPGRTVTMTKPETKERFILDIKEECSFTISKQKALHRANDKTDVIFELREEAEGSIRLLDLIPMLIDLHQHEVDYLVDDFDQSLNPLLSKRLIECYLEQLSEDRDTQLIISTHESVLDNHLVRLVRSEGTWLIEKSLDQASKLVCLADFKSNKPSMHFCRRAPFRQRTALPSFPIELLYCKNTDVKESEESNN